MGAEPTNVDSDELAVPTYPCRPITLAEVTVGEQWIDTSWVDTTGGAYGHRVYKRKVGDSIWDLETVTPVAKGINVYRIRGLETGTSYEWTVTSINTS